MNEELNRAFEQISDEHINEAAVYQKRRFPWVKAIAAVLAIIIAWSAVWHEFDFPPTIIFPADTDSTEAILHNTTPTDPTSLTPTTPNVPNPTNPVGPIVIPLSGLVARPTYPQMALCPNYSDYGHENYKAYENALGEWYKSRREQYDQPMGYADSLDDFWAKSIPEFLSGEGNRAYSPVNVYLALAMLAEVTGGESRQQVLDLLDADSIEALRTQAGHVWNAHYCNDGETTSLLANSLWLDDAYGFKNDTIQTLADSYYAAVFHGDLGTEEMNDLLKNWIDSQTGELSKEHTDNLELPPSTVFALCSTLYYTAGWRNTFDESRTSDAVFRSTAGDVTAAFMHDTILFGTYYWGSNFGAVRLELTKGYMWLILPDEGCTVDDVLDNDEYLTMALSPDRWKNQKDISINLSLPKFEISKQNDLIASLKNLGITDVFKSGVADFSPMTNADTPYVSQVDHAVRVAIDEDGAMAAAYAIIMVAPGSPPPPDDEMDFTLDRPFLFMVTDDVPLFAGVVEQP